jgi:hypothetical protein
MAVARLAAVQKLRFNNRVARLVVGPLIGAIGAICVQWLFVPGNWLNPERVEPRVVALELSVVKRQSVETTETERYPTARIELTNSGEEPAEQCQVHWKAEERRPNAEFEVQERVVIEALKGQVVNEDLLRELRDRVGWYAPLVISDPISLISDGEDEVTLAATTPVPERTLEVLSHAWVDCTNGYSRHFTVRDSVPRSDE